MPSWKKVIVSGSDASLNSLVVNSGVTGSLQGTASWANNVVSASYATTASYALFATSASYASSSTSASYALTASSALNASDILIYVKNSTGNQINKGTVVRIDGAVGDNPLISTASYTDDNNSANTLGITNENIPNDSFGYVMTEGKLLGIDTSAFTVGQLIYLGATGSITGSAPVAPLHAVRLGQVLRVQQNNGSMYVRIDNGYELGELHDVKDTTTTGSYGDLLVKSGSIWINSKQLTGSYGLTGSLQATSFTGSLQGTSSYATNTLSASYALNTTSASYSNNSTSASYAITATTASFASTIANGLNITASSLYINNNLTVNGTASFNYVQSITGSAVIIGQEYIVLNTQLPAARFAGLQIYDSGSNSTASLVWDSQTDHFIYSKTSGSTYNGGMFIAGPKNTGSLGQEQTLTQWRVPVAQGDDHIMDSQIYSSGSTTIITGSLNVTAGITGSLQGTASWANNATSASYALVATSASYSNNSTSASYALNATSASYANNATSASYSNNSTSASFASNTAQAQTASYVLNAVSASFASTASSVNTLNQSVLITGSLTVGASTLGSAENTLTLGPRGTNEGGQLLLQTGTSYTSASMLDVYHDGTNPYFRILRGSNAGSDAIVAQFNVHSKQVQFPAYTGSGAFTGTAAANLAVDSSGNVITVAVGGGSLSGGSANYVAVWDSTTTLTTRSIYDDGNVGIGTTAPGYKFHVKGTDIGGVFEATSTAGSGFVSSLNSADGHFMQMRSYGSVTGATLFGNSTNKMNSIWSNNDTLFTIGTIGATPLILGTNNAERVRILSDGNVGIGTTNPLTTLDVRGTITAQADSAYYRVRRAAGTDVGYIVDSGTWGDSGTDFSIGASSSNLRFYTNNSVTERMRLDSAGRLGIGTTAPLTILHTRQTNAGAAVIGALLQNASDNANTAVSLDFAPHSTGTTLARISALRTALNNGPTDLVFSTYNDGISPTGLNERMRITATGNVGIGTTSPAARLQVSGSNTDAIFQINSPASSSILVVSGSGNIGIGTTSPDTLLNIYGTAEKAYLNVNALAGFAGIGSGSNAMVTFNNRSDGNNVLIRTNNSARTDAAPFAVWTENNSRFIILNNGNVGVGTTTPQNVLHVHGTSDGLGYVRITDSVTGATSTDGLRIGYNSGVLRFQNYENSDIQFLTNNTTEAIRIKSDGNVGVGTTAPVSKLQVIAADGYSSFWSNNASNYTFISIGRTSSELEFGVAAGANQFFTGTVAGDAAIKVPPNKGNLFIGATSGAPAMVISQSNSIGIGTLTPTAKLDVEGDIQLLNANYNAYSSSVSGTTTLATIATSSYNAVFFDFVAFSGSNQRAGTLIGSWNSGTVQYTEYSTIDIGSTAAAVTMSVSLSGANALVQSVTAPGWAIKATYRTV